MARPESEVTFRVEQRAGDEWPWELVGSPQVGYAVWLEMDAAHDVASQVRKDRLHARIVEMPEGEPDDSLAWREWRRHLPPMPCTTCGGVGEWTVAACCGQLTRSGDCCGDPVPVAQMCGPCEGTGMAR